MLMINHGIPLMLKNGRGSIINTSSGAALRGDLYGPAYASSKAAINCLTKYVATQFGKKGIRCNVISPGLVVTPNVHLSNSRSAEHTSELQSLMRISYAVFCLKKTNKITNITKIPQI